MQSSSGWQKSHDAQQLVTDGRGDDDNGAFAARPHPPAATIMIKPVSQASASRVEWEMLPSLLNMLGNRRARSTPAWMDTVVSDFNFAEPSTPFEEVLPGLSVREVSEPEIFQIFFC
jgi:hypothetical protein